MHGGTVTLDSRVGVGSTFTILLPILVVTTDDGSESTLPDPDEISEEDIAEATIRARRTAMNENAKKSQQNPTETVA